MDTSSANQREIELDAGDGVRSVSEPSQTEAETRVHALERLGAAVALGAETSTLQQLGRRSILAGASIDDIVGTLLAVAPIVGEARLVNATPGVALSIGYDVDEALESPA
jgi:hypothetical protein